MAVDVRRRAHLLRNLGERDALAKKFTIFKLKVIHSSSCACLYQIIERGEVLSGMRSARRVGRFGQRLGEIEAVAVEFLP